MKNLALACCLSLLPATAFAQPGYPSASPGRYRFEFTPHVSYHFGGTIDTRNSGDFPNDVKLDDGAGFGATLDFPLGGNLQLDLLFDYQSADVVRDNGLFGSDQPFAKLDVIYGHVGLLVPFGDQHVSPYFVGAIGFTNLDAQGPGTSSDTKFSASIGGGLKAFFGRNIGLRLEGRYFWTYLDNYDSGGCYGGCYDTTDYLSQWQTSLGLIFAW